MKILVKIVVGLLLILIAVPILAILLLDANLLKEEVGARVAQATGRELALEGDLRLSVFPWIGIEVRDASLAQRPGFGDIPFARIGEAQVRVRLLPLLRGRFELDEIRGRGLSLTLIRAQDGRTNWDDLTGAAPRGAFAPIVPPEGHPSPGSVPPLGSGEAAAPAQQLVLSETEKQVGPAAVEPAIPKPLPQPERSGSPGPSAPVFPPLVSFSIGGIAFDDVRIDWDDQQVGTHLSLDGWTLSTGPLSRDAPLDLHLDGDILERDTALSAHLALDSTLTLSPNGRELTLAPLGLRLRGLKVRDGLEAEASLSGSLTADMALRRYRSEELTLVLEVGGAPPLRRPVGIDARAALDLDLIAETLRFDRLTLESGALRLNGEISGAALLSRPGFQGRLAADQLDLRAWLEQQTGWVPDTADPKALTLVSLNTGWSAVDGRLDLEGLDLALDRSRITGTAALIQGSPPGYRFDLVADELDLDAYLPSSAGLSLALRRSPGTTPIPPPSQASVPQPAKKPAPGASAPPVAHPAAAQPPVADAGQTAVVPRTPAVSESAGGVEPFPARQIQGLDLEGRIRVARLRGYGLRLGDVDARVSARNGRLRIDERIDRFYQGRLQGHAELATEVDPPVLMLVQQADGIDVGPLLTDLVGEDFVTGNGRLEADLRAAGRTPDALKRNLSGQTALHLSMGSVKGFNLEHFIRRAEARLKGRPPPPPEPQKTDFTELRASASVKEGVFVNRDLSARSNYIHASGRGTIDVANERLNYLLEPRFVDPPEGRGIKEIEDIPIPIKITGGFERPDLEIDLAPVLRGVAKRELKEALGEEGGGRLKELEERTGIKGLEKGLRSLFNF